MHDNRMTTTQTSVFGLPVNMSLKRTFTQLWCCNLLHGREGGVAESNLRSRCTPSQTTFDRSNFGPCKPKVTEEGAIYQPTLSERVLERLRGC
jgi:hypothetical protein